ncbi:MurR/RpiR family transcriptional regulator [Fusibacter ferrireducens]|uniref:MurR/RpiR family transcriptional regulator n=1 Tax=Fusibacter ferrireducens TaxID=2785058 RepID=A0ABR9ZRZ1_9FIRM|nr:MurR/RpiR family transcriptional regulator [Fusibacter ferrireducens]MBF4693217.1 MurR/RpiR family transcriptional regulator [Fusibacter ferrireducens]
MNNPSPFPQIHNLNPFEQMAIKRNTFTKKELVIYEIFTKDLASVFRDSMADIAEKYNVSQATITRFCQKVGYNGYNEFKYDLYRYQKKGTIIQQGPREESVFSLYAKLIMSIEAAIDDDTMRQISNEILCAKHVVISGTHKSALPAQLLQFNLFKYSIGALFIGNDAMQDIRFFLNDPSSILILFTIYGGHYKRLFDDYLSDAKGKIVVITANNKFTYKSRTDHMIWLPTAENQNYSRYLENQISPFVFTDILSSYIADALNR